MGHRSAGRPGTAGAHRPARPFVRRGYIYISSVYFPPPLFASVVCGPGYRPRPALLDFRRLVVAGAPPAITGHNPSAAAPAAVGTPQAPLGMDRRSRPWHRLTASARRTLSPIAVAECRPPGR